LPREIRASEFPTRLPDETFENSDPCVYEWIANELDVL
jgi:hypothetical protein